MPQDAGHAFCRCAMTAPMSLFYTFGRNINDSNYYNFIYMYISGQYFCMNMILITLSTFLAVIIIQTHIRGDRKNKVPPWLKRVRIAYCMGEPFNFLLFYQ